MTQVLNSSGPVQDPHRDRTTQTHTDSLTAELSRHSDLPLLDVDVRVDGHSVVVSHLEGLNHALLQRLRHVLLGHVEDAQVGKTDTTTTTMAAV